MPPRSAIANTRAAYLQAAHQLFLWCEEHGLELRQIRPLHVAAYIEAKQRELSPPLIKQHLAGLQHAVSLAGVVLAFERQIIDSAVDEHE